jgi:hypothetical protein
VTSTSTSETLHSWLRQFGGTEASHLSERLVRALEAHAAAEAADVVTCRQVAERLDDPVVDLLVGMIVQDEQSHERLLRSMIRRLQGAAFVTSSNTGPVPTGPGFGTVEAAAETAAIVRGLIRNEHEGSRHLRHLARQEPTRYDGLYPVLLETVARDSEKHAAMLPFLLRRIEERVERVCEPSTLA